MKKIYFALIASLSFYSGVYAQTESKRDSITLNKNSGPVLPQPKIGNANSSSVTEFKLPDFGSKKADLDYLKPREMTYKFEKLKELSTPFKAITTLNPLVSTSFNYNSGLMDYDNIRVRRLTDRSAYMIQGTSNNYIGMGLRNSMGASYIYQPANRWNIAVGAEAVKYSNLRGNYNDFVFKASTSYDVTDWLKVDVFGQYSVNALRNQNSSMMYSPFAPQSNYGGGLTLKLTDDFGVRVGAVREFDVMKRKWVTYPTFEPVFYNK